MTAGAASSGIFLGSEAAASDPITSIPGMLFWNDPAATYLMKDGAELVSSFTERFGGHIWTASGTERPEYEANAINGQPGLRVVGAQKMDCIDGLAELLNVSQPYTFVSIAQWDATNDTQVVLGCGDQGAGFDLNLHYVQLNGSPLSIQYLRGDGGNTANNTTVPVGSAPVQQAWIYDGTAASFRIQDTPVAGGGNTRVPVCDLATLFSRKASGVYGAYAKGVFCESFAWDHELTAPEWDTVNARNLAKYGVPP